MYAIYKRIAKSKTKGSQKIYPIGQKCRDYKSYKKDMHLYQEIARNRI